MKLFRTKQGFIVAIVSVVILIAGITFARAQLKESKAAAAADNAFDQALSLYRQGRYEDAKALTNNIPNHKEIPTLQKLIDIRFRIASQGQEQLEKTIYSEASTALADIANGYNGALKTDVETLRKFVDDKFTESMIKLNHEKQKQDSVDLRNKALQIDNGHYINIRTITDSEDPYYALIKAFSNYGWFSAHKNDKDSYENAVAIAWQLIDVSQQAYQRYKDKVDAIKAELGTSIFSEAEKRRNAYLEQRAKPPTPPPTPRVVPTIGMTMDEVLKSTWGEPREKSITTTRTAKAKYGFILQSVFYTLRKEF